MNIQNFSEEHYHQVADIYMQGIATGHATFQSQAPSWEEWNQAHLIHSRLATVDKDVMTGWAALSLVNGRCVYAGVAEVSIYIASAFHGQGIGYFLLNELVQSSEQHGLWTLQSGIFPENIGSFRLHEKCGFRVVGYREKIGKMNDLWRDTILLERRSKQIGI